ncbi:MAG: class I SAM-dependent methyltransferase [Candidatus Binatia bacterium]
MKQLVKRPAGVLRVLRPKQIKSRFEQFLYESYYKHVFGKKTRLATHLSGRVASWEKRHGRRDIPVSQEMWDSEYAAGVWGDLGDLEELARYSVIAGYIQFLKPGGSVLDVGCGEGILLHRLNPEAYSKYLGIDFSKAAIDHAAAKSAAHMGRFAQADAEKYVPDEDFDAIIFNEVLYILDQPLEVVQRYESWLRPGGVFIISFYEKSARAVAVSSRLKERYNPIDEVRISTKTDAWIIHVLAPKPRSRRDDKIS